MTAQPIRNPFTLYSCIIDDFACLDYSENKGVQYKTGTDIFIPIVSSTAYCLFLLPSARFRRPPAGQPERNKTNSAKNRIDQFHFQTSASDINKTVPRLYPLLEAMSGRVDLQMPGDVFRLNDRIEFIDMATNTILEKKSEIFTQAMKKKDFRFRSGVSEAIPL